MCRRNNAARFDEATQVARHCTLPGFNRGAWTGEKLVRVHMGARPRYGIVRSDGRPRDDHQPVEDIEREGCPGAWYRTRFVASLLTYYRRRDEHGGRVPNPALDACDDPLVHEAIGELEAHEEVERNAYLDRKARAEEATR